MIDTNVDLFQWPFRRIAGDDPASLVALLRKKGVTQAWTCSYEALLMRDVAGVNIRLADACGKHGPNFLVPFGTVNPKEPDWQDDVRRCAEVHKMPGIRLHPNYHGYALDDPVAAELLTLAASHKLVVQIALMMEDTRVQFPLMQVPTVNPAPLVDLMKGMPDLHLELLNAGYSGGGETGHMKELGQLENVYFDIAHQEGVGGVARLIKQTSASRVLFGSNFPFFYFESSLLKVREAGLTKEETHAVMDGNAQTFLKH
jgi:predicted TIM-barrel fold metal-dependent hydrolase